MSCNINLLILSVMVSLLVLLKWIVHVVGGSSDFLFDMRTLFFVRCLLFCLFHKSPFPDVKRCMNLFCFHAPYAVLNCVFVFLFPILLPCLLVYSLLYFHFPEIAFENGKPCKSVATLLLFLCICSCCANTSANCLSIYGFDIFRHDCLYLVTIYRIVFKLCFMLLFKGIFPQSA